MTSSTLGSWAKEQDIPFARHYPFYGSDASAAMSAGAEVKHALLELVMSPVTLRTNTH